MNEEISNISSRNAQKVGWYIQVAGTIVLLFGVTISLGALPVPVDGRFASVSDLQAFFLLLGGSFVIGFILTFAGIIYGLVARQRTKKAEGKIIHVRDLLSKRQKSIGLLLIFGSMVAMITSIIRVVTSLQ